MRVLGLVLLAAFAGGCTSVKMVRRDGCWIKRTEKIFGRVREEIGPCSRPQPAWVDDRLTRLVQECVAQADYRWQGHALEAWSKGRPYPAQPPQEEILHACMEEARVGLVTEKEALERRVADLSSDRDTLRADVEKDRDHLRTSHDRIAEYLGEAAQKPAGNATATASSTSDGKATNESGTTLASESSSGSGASGVPAAAPGIPVAAASPASPAVPGVVPASPAASAPATAPASATPRPPKIARARRPPPVCEPCNAPSPEKAEGSAR